MSQTHTYAIFLLLLCMSNIIQGSHFRGSMISWRVINASSSPLVLEIFQRYAWRYTFFAPLCTSATIPLGQPILGSVGSNIVCVSTCPTGLTTLGSVQVPCTGYNTAEQYAMGEGRFTLTIPKNSSFVAVFSSNAWFALVTGNNLAWSVAVQIQTFLRTDNGQYNNAPIVTMLPIYRLRNQISYSIKINVADNDFDPYICLWSNGPTQCGGLNDSVPGATVNNYACYLNFTPNIIGYYAAALTVEDFMIIPVNISSTNYLSQVPIQFIFHVYNSSNPCVPGPIYVGDLVPDVCIYMSIGATYTTRVRFQVQCVNATVNSIISVNPTGLLITPVQQDPFDSTIFTFLATFTSSANQIGQNLFCFAAVDSIGNQGDSACLRFTVLSQTSSLQPLYTSNTTRFPMGTVSKTTSLWTMLTGSNVYVRPTTETYIRFKLASNNADYHILNVVTAINNVFYLNGSIVINSTVLWTPGEYYYIYFDPGVFSQSVTCTKESMPIIDSNFWPFNIPDETTTTSTSSTTATSATSTTTTRAILTRKTFGTSTTTTSETTSTTTPNIIFKTSISTTTVRSPYQLSISAIVGITLACLFIGALITWIILSIIRMALIRYFLLESGLRQQFFGIHSPSKSDPFHDLTTNDDFTLTHQYKLATRHCQPRNIGKYSASNHENTLQKNLVEVRV